MDAGGAVTIDVSTALLATAHQTCAMTPTMYYLELYVLDERQFAAISVDEYDAHNCYDEAHGSFDVTDCWYFTHAAAKYAVPLNESLSATHTLRTASSYRVVLVNPCNATYAISGRISLRNPWRRFAQLSASERWHPDIVLAAALLYAVGLAAWSLALYRRRAQIRIHHKVLTLLLALRTLGCAVHWASFVAYAADGVAAASDAVAHELLAALFEVVGFLFLFMVSCGYVLYRPRMNYKQMRVALLSIALYGFVCALNETCFLFGAYCHFIELFQFILRCFLLVGIVALLNALISSVHTVVRQEQWRAELAQAYLLLRAHKVLRWAFYAYVIGPIAVYILYLSIAHWTEEWLYVMLNTSVIEPALLAAIYWHFRPSHFFVHVEGVF